MPRAERSCFIIGPMRDADQKDNARLKVLAREIIGPLLAEIGQKEGVQYRVTSPYDLGGSHIMHDVIYAIDRADLVVADLTDGNPNVFYELGITHSLGRACITLVEASRAQFPFDVSAYRIHKIDLEGGAYQEAQQALHRVVEKAHRDISDWTKLENPVIDFFRAPVTYISPSFSLAQGYYTNFVKPVGESLIKRKGARFLYDVGVGDTDQPAPRQLADATLLSEAIRQELELLIVIPERIAFAKHQYVDRMRGALPHGIVEGDGRHYTCFFKAGTDDACAALVDVPTTIRVLDDAVDRRMRLPNTSHDHSEWREVEAQEIDRFATNLQLMINRHDHNPEFGQRIRVLRYDPADPGDLAWFHQLVSA